MSNQFDSENEMEGTKTEGFGKDVLGVGCIKNNLEQFGKECVGELQTIVEAIVPERHRQDPSKSIIRQAFWRRLNELKERLLSIADSGMEE